MAEMEETRSDPEQQLFDELGKLRAGMLGVPGSGQHMQPMSHHLDEAARTLRFITSRKTDLVEAIGQGADAHFCVIGADQDFHACLRGKLTVSDDAAKLDEVWSIAAAAWFEQGRDDPDIVLLEMPLRDAAIWSTTDSATVFGLEIAKAAATSGQPDVGARAHVDFARAG